ncbi:MAG: hypothetical protein JXP73_14425 [Deltaproteobacteria bacterium]|jgi:hypothetical protein|nr:hypothetical protein [Deltaproteobacteria bacterium]
MLKFNRVVPIALGMLLFASGAQAAKPEDVFKGRIFITEKRLPTRFASQGAFISAVRRSAIDKVWPTEEKGNDHAVWKLEYIAFFARPLNDNEITLKFWELGMGSPRFVAGDEQYTRERGTRIFSAAITLAKPEFDTNKRYRMTIESGRRLLAETTFWLRGKGPKYSGKVEFTDEEAQRK